MSTMTGVRPLLSVTLRQNLRTIAPWAMGVTALSASSILAYRLIFDDPQQRATLAQTLGSNPALGLVFGVPRNLMTADGFNAWRAGVLGAAAAALMAILVVIQNSRANEDSGQAELLASGVLSRPARLIVAVLTAWVGSLAIGVLAFVVTVLVGGGVTSTLVLALTFVAAGFMFAGIAAIAAQLASDVGSATGIAAGLLGASYLIRGVADTSASAGWARWVSPLGWLEETKPASGNNPWPLLLAAGLGVVTVLLALWLQARRDFGQGFIAPRGGPARAGYTGSVWGLAVKLNRGSLIGWGVGFIAIGVMLGNLISSVKDLFGSNPALEAFAAAGGGASPVFGFVVTMLQITGLIAAIFGTQAVMRIYGEETSTRTESLLAGSLRRSTYLASNSLVAFIGPSLVFLVGGVAIAFFASASDTSSFGNTTLQALVTLPAVWVMIAVGLAAVGARPAIRMLGWLVIVASFALTLLGPTFKLPNWALGISPLYHVPNVTVASPNWTGLVALILIACALTAVAFAGYQRRDIG